MNPHDCTDHHATSHREPATEPRWRRALGLQLLGPVQGSGLRDPAFLVRRSDDQMVQLSELLHLVVVHAEPPRTSAEVAADVSAAYGRTLTVEGLEHLVTTRLAAARTGRARRGRGAGRGRSAARPLLALTAQGDPAPGAVDAAPAAACSAPLLLAAGRPAPPWSAWSSPTSCWSSAAASGAAVIELFATPTLALVIYALLTAGRGGPRARSRGGLPLRRRRAGRDRRRHLHRLPGLLHRRHRLLPPRPRRPGAHRPRRALLQRALRAGRSRLRYLATGSGLLLLTAFALQVQMLQQLIPVVRFDGYFVLSDLAGVPDLFARVGPVLRSLRPGHPVDPRVSELRPLRPALRDRLGAGGGSAA